MPQQPYKQPGNAEEEKLLSLLFIAFGFSTSISKLQCYHTRKKKLLQDFSSFGIPPFNLILLQFFERETLAISYRWNSFLIEIVTASLEPTDLYLIYQSWT